LISSALRIMRRMEITSLFLKMKRGETVENADRFPLCLPFKPSRFRPAERTFPPASVRLPGSGEPLRHPRRTTRGSTAPSWNSG